MTTAMQNGFRKTIGSIDLSDPFGDQTFAPHGEQKDQLKTHTKYPNTMHI